MRVQCGDTVGVDGEVALDEVGSGGDHGDCCVAVGGKRTSVLEVPVADDCVRG